VQNTNYVLTTTEQGIPVWSSIIEGGTYWWQNQQADKNS
jgi:hypothetical protein